VVYKRINEKNRILSRIDFGAFSFWMQKGREIKTELDFGYRLAPLNVGD